MEAPFPQVLPLEGSVRVICFPLQTINLSFNIRRLHRIILQLIMLCWSYSDVDECAKSPCKNGGSCTNTAGSFTCKCQQGFQGKLCDQGSILFPFLFIICCFKKWKKKTCFTSSITRLSWKLHVVLKQQAFQGFANQCCSSLRVVFSGGGSNTISMIHVTQPSKMWINVST